MNVLHPISPTPPPWCYESSDPRRGGGGGEGAAAQHSEARDLHLAQPFTLCLTLKTIIRPLETFCPHFQGDNNIYFNQLTELYINMKGLWLPI